MGKGNRGYARPKPNLGVQAKVERLTQIATTSPRLEKLLTEIVERRLSPRCYGLFKRLAYVPPVARLCVNLKTLLGIMATKDIKSVLLDGLSSDERAALMEVDASGMSLESRRTAHTLLDIDTRIRVVETTGGIFRDTRTRKQHALSDKPLDN